MHEEIENRFEKFVEDKGFVFRGILAFQTSEIKQFILDEVARVRREAVLEYDNALFKNTSGFYERFLIWERRKKALESLEREKTTVDEKKELRKDLEKKFGKISPTQHADCLPDFTFYRLLLNEEKIKNTEGRDNIAGIEDK